MSLSSNLCLFHKEPEIVVVRTEDGLQVLCQNCFKQKYIQHPHIILNDDSKNFFKQWTECILEHYNSVLQSHQTKQWLPIFEFSQNLQRRISDRDKISFIEELLRAQIQVHLGNIQFISNNKSIDELKNPFFLNDLLNFYHESAISNIKGLPEILEANLKRKGYGMFNNEIHIDQTFIQSLEQAKSVIKSKYQKQLQVSVHSTETPQFKEQMKIHLPNHESNKISEDPSSYVITPKRQVNIDQKHFQEKTGKKKKDEQTTQWTEFIQIRESRYKKSLQEVIEKLEEQNIHLREWKNQIEDYLNQMTNKIQQLTPRIFSNSEATNSQKSSRVLEKSSQQMKSIKILQEKISDLQIAVENQSKQKKRLQYINEMQCQNIKMFESQIHEKQEQLIIAENTIAFKMKEIEDIYISQIDKLKKQRHELSKTNANLLDDNQSKNKMIHELIADNREVKSENSRLLIVIEDQKQKLAAFQKQNEKKQVKSEEEGQSDNQSVEDIANQIKQKMNKINSLIRISSMPQLRQKSRTLNYQQKQFDTISPTNPLSISSKEKQKQNLFEDLTKKIQAKNIQIEELYKANEDLKKLKLFLEQRIKNTEENSQELICQLNQKIKEAQNQIYRINEERQKERGEVQFLKKQISDIIGDKEKIQNSLMTKQELVNNLNKKITELQSSVKELSKPKKAEQINDELLEEVILYEAQIQKKKKMIESIIEVCKRVVTGMEACQNTEIAIYIQDLKAIANLDSS